MAIQADKSLVQGAFKKGQAKAMSGITDMSAQFRSDAAISKTITDTMTNVMGNIKLKKDQEKVAFEKGLEPFKAIANKAYETLHSQGEPLPQKFIDAVTAEVERLQDEFEAVNTQGKGDTRANERERMRIQGQLKRITNEAINARASFMKIGQSAGDWNTQFIKPENVASMQAALDLDKADKNDNYNVAFVDGKLTITVSNYNEIRGSVEKLTDTYDPDAEVAKPTDEVIERFGEPVSFTLSQMEDALPTKNKATDAMLMQDITNNEEEGKNDRKQGKPNKWQNRLTVERAEHAYASLIKTPKQYQAHIREIDGIGNGGFVEGLWSNVDIPMTVIQTMFVDDAGNPTELGAAFNQLDVNNDQVIGQEDYEKLRENENWQTFEKNIEALHDALVNVNNPAFHLKTSVDLLAKYKVAHDIQAYRSGFGEEEKNILGTAVAAPTDATSVPLDITPNPTKKDGTESPIPPFVKDAIEGKYYKNKNTGQTYIFEDGEYTELADESKL